MLMLMRCESIDGRGMTRAAGGGGRARAGGRRVGGHGRGRARAGTGERTGAGGHRREDVAKNLVLGSGAATFCSCNENNSKTKEKV